MVHLLNKADQQDDSHGQVDPVALNLYHNLTENN